MTNKNKVVFIHFVGSLLNEEYQEDAGRARLFELIHNGWSVNCSVYDHEDNVVYVTLAREEATV